MDSSRDDLDRGSVVLDLGRAQWIGQGYNRDCYLHPEDSSLCIKLPKDDPQDDLPLRDSLAKWRNGESAGDLYNRSEWQAFEQFGKILAPFVPRYHGFAETSRGRGLVIDAVCDQVGTPSIHLKKWLKMTTTDKGESLLQQFRILFDLLENHDLWLMDLNFQNFLVQVMDDGTERLWLTDIKRLPDSKEIYQLSGWSKTRRRRKFARRIELFHSKYQTALSG